MTQLYKGDDTNAFDAKFLTIELENAQGLQISKAVFKCGTILKEFENPTFPLSIDLCCEETLRLNCSNTCYLAIYDDKGRKRTCSGSLCLIAKNEVV